MEERPGGKPSMILERNPNLADSRMNFCLVKKMDKFWEDESAKMIL